MPTDPRPPDGGETSPDELRTRPGRATDIRSVLQEEIETGTLPPGATLDERALAARFEVSRTPVREALQQLAARDLVRIAPRQGVTVARLSIAKVRAMMEFIAELEALAAKLAARRVDDETARQLDDALARCQEAAVNGGAAEYSLANSLFHETIYAGCRNAYLAEQVRQARRMIQRYRVKDFQNKAQISKSLQEHLKIARAIEQGDEAAAAQAMLLHVPIGSTGFSEFLAKVPMAFFESEAGEAS
ncbi:MAG: GntR family transcriptional regulator [Burkholderiales bacterium]|nr:GntR family transcriptional regulator [Burkholderiales bacterium]MDE2453744.1 GntR family transcriptional regulator [Burkholderiales bacterium]